MDLAADGNFSVGYPYGQTPGQGAGDIDVHSSNNTIVITKTTGSIGTALLTAMLMVNDEKGNRQLG
jgi:hypothetical protein